MSDLLGSGVIGSATGSNPVGSGSLPDSPAIYVDDFSGQQVNESWWPGDPIDDAA